MSINDANNPPLVVWLFQVVEEPGMIFHAHARNTLYQLMDLLCKKFISKVRGDGDGDVDDHIWVIQCDHWGTRHMGVHPMADSSWVSDADWVPETMHASTFLSEVELEVGQTLEIDFNYCKRRSTQVDLRVMKTKTYKGDAVIGKHRRAGVLPFMARPKAPPVDAYEPPVGTPLLDEVFPNIGKLLFGDDDSDYDLPPLVRSVILFPCLDTAALVVAGSTEGSPLVHAAKPFDSLLEALVALELGATIPTPDYVSRDEFSRVLFDAHASAHDMAEQAPNDVATRCAVQVTADDVAKYASEVNLPQAFPVTTAAYQKYVQSSRHGTIKLWVEYRPLVHTVKIYRGKATNGYLSNRKPVATAVKIDIESLHELLCIIEALWMKVQPK